MVPEEEIFYKRRRGRKKRGGGGEEDEEERSLRPGRERKEEGEEVYRKEVEIY